MPVAGRMMWRFSALFNYIRGNVRSGAWRVRETPSQLLSDDREDRDDPRLDLPPAGEAASSECQQQAGQPPAPAHVGRWAQRISAHSAPPRHRPCGVGGLTPAVHGPTGGGLTPRDPPGAGTLPGPAAVRLPPGTALWYLGQTGRPTTAATAATATGVTDAATTAAGSASEASVIASPVSSVSSPTAATAASPLPARVAASSSVPPADSAGTATTSAAAVDDGSAAEENPEPIDALSSLRISFAAEHDRLMAGLQNAAGAGVATSRPHQALECFRTAAALGSPAAWFNCALCFQEGRGTDVDLQKAVECYEEAVRLGHASAGFNLALLAAAGRVPVTSSRRDVTGLLERAAAAGSAEAAQFLETWRDWSDEQEEDAEDGWLGLSPPGRSVSLPVLCGPQAGPGPLEPWSPEREDRQPVFYLHESP